MLLTIVRGQEKKEEEELESLGEAGREVNYQEKERELVSGLAIDVIPKAVGDCITWSFSLVAMEGSNRRIQVDSIIWWI